MALLVAGIAFDAYEVSLRDKPPAMLAVSPKGSVPVMVLADGQVLEESWDIMRWALDRPATSDWWEAAQTPENQACLRRNDGEFKHHLDRYKYPERFGEADPQAHYAQAFAFHLNPLAERLAQHAFLGGQAPCATDLALFPFVRQFAAVAPERFAKDAPPSLQNWLSFWLSNPLFVHCMIKLPGQTATPFPPLVA